VGKVTICHVLFNSPTRHRFTCCKKQPLDKGKRDIAHTEMN